MRHGRYAYIQHIDMVDIDYAFAICVVHSGFFFSHIGWLLCKKHPDVREKGRGVDMSDLRADPVLRFQSK